MRHAFSLADRSVEQKRSAKHVGNNLAPARSRLHVLLFKDGSCRVHLNHKSGYPDFLAAHPCPA